MGNATTNITVTVALSHCRRRRHHPTITYYPRRHCPYPHPHPHPCPRQRADVGCYCSLHCGLSLVFWSLWSSSLMVVVRKKRKHDREIRNLPHLIIPYLCPHCYCHIVVIPTITPALTRTYHTDRFIRVAVAYVLGSGISRDESKMRVHEQKWQQK